MSYLFISLLFIALGALIKYGKMYFLLAGYNTMSAKEKANYRIEKAAQLFWRVMLYMGGVIILGQVIEMYIGWPVGDYFFWASILSGLPYLLWKSNSRSYFRNQL